MKLNVNGRVQDVDVEPEMPLLWVLRDAMGLEGTYTPTATNYRRHLFEGEVRLVNLSSRREEPK